MTDHAQEARRSIGHANEVGAEAVSDDAEVRTALNAAFGDVFQSLADHLAKIRNTVLEAKTEDVMADGSDYLRGYTEGFAVGMDAAEDFITAARAAL